MLNIYIKLLPLQGVTNERTLTQGVASLALGYVLLPFQGVHFRLCLRSFKNNDPQIISPLIGATTNVAQVATRR